MAEKRNNAPENLSEYSESGMEKHNPQVRKKRKRRKQTPIYKLVINDILLTGIVLLIFATFHHVIPRLTASQMKTPEPVTIVAPKSEQNESSGGDDANSGENASTQISPEQEATPEPETTPEPEPIELSWREKFASYFTEDVVMTDSSYTSPNVSITISTLRDEEANTQYYVADIYLSSIDCLKTEFPYGSYNYYGAQNAAALSKSVNALIAVNGDYADNQQSGFLVRNGEMYFSDPVLYYDICVLYYDGTMETYGPGEYDVDEIISKAPYQSFKFGPALLENGIAKTSFNCTNAIAFEPAPRAGIGYYEPGHYCLVVGEGRGVHNSRGFVISDFAKMFEELGCAAAYNLDGGQTAIMTFGGNNYSTPSGGGRDVGEIIYICDAAGEN